MEGRKGRKIKLNDGVIIHSILCFVVMFINTLIVSHIEISDEYSFVISFLWMPYFIFWGLVILPDAREKIIRKHIFILEMAVITLFILLFSLLFSQISVGVLGYNIISI